MAHPFHTDEQVSRGRQDLAQAFQFWLSTVNDFSQQDPHKWTSATGHLGVFNSQVNGLINDKLSPREKFCVGLGNFNAAIAAQTFEGVSDSKLITRLRAATPFLTVDGDVATGVDFYAMLIGAIPVREEYLSKGVDLPPDEIAAAAEALRTSFREIAKNNLLTRKEAWDSFCGSQALLARSEDSALEIITGWDGSDTSVNATALREFSQQLKDWEDALQ